MQLGCKGKRNVVINKESKCWSSHRFLLCFYCRISYYLKVKNNFLCHWEGGNTQICNRRLWPQYFCVTFLTLFLIVCLFFPSLIQFLYDCTARSFYSFFFFFLVCVECRFIPLHSLFILISQLKVIQYHICSVLSWILRHRSLNAGLAHYYDSPPRLTRHLNAAGPRWYNCTSLQENVVKHLHFINDRL